MSGKYDYIRDKANYERIHSEGNSHINISGEYRKRKDDMSDYRIEQPVKHKIQEILEIEDCNSDTIFECIIYEINKCLQKSTEEEIEVDSDKMVGALNMIFDYMDLDGESFTNTFSKYTEELTYTLISLRKNLSQSEINTLNNSVR